MRLLIAVLLCLMAAPPVSLADSDKSAVEAPENAAIRIGSNGELQQVVSALIARGRYDDAGRLIRWWQPGHPDHAIRVRYVDGLIASAKGDDETAALVFREILAQRPKLESVRLALTGALFRLDRDDAARFQATQLIAAGVDDRIGGTLQGIVRQIDARRPLRLRGFFSLLPSTNLNAGADGRQVRVGDLSFEIDEEARKKSGIGFLAGAELSAQQRLSRATSVIATVDGTVRHYPSINRTDLSAAGSAGVERRFGSGRVLPAGIAGIDLEDGSVVRHYFGARIQTALRFGEKMRAFIAPSIRFERYPEIRGENGWVGDIPLRFDRFIGADRFVRGILGYTHGEKREDRFSFREFRGGFGSYAELPLGITLYGQGTFAMREYGGDFPGLTEPRSDRRLNLALTATKRDFEVFGFAPQVSYAFERNRSNSAFHDRTRHDVELRFTSEF